MYILDYQREKPADGDLTDEPACIPVAMLVEDCTSIASSAL